MPDMEEETESPCQPNLPLKTNCAGCHSPPPGQTHEDFKQLAPIEVVMDPEDDTLVHWKDSCLMCADNKWIFTRNTKGIGEARRQQLRQCKFSGYRMTEMWRRLKVWDFIKSMPEERNDFFKTPGQWFYSAFSYKGLDILEMEKPKVAYHGTSITSAVKIIKSGGLVKGFNESGGKEGVYMEGEETGRLGSCFIYMPHVMVNASECLLVAAVFELTCDRAKGRTHKGQWVQPSSTIVATGLYTHVVSLLTVYDKGYVGWTNVHDYAWKQLQCAYPVKDPFIVKKGIVINPDG